MPRTSCPVGRTLRVVAVMSLAHMHPEAVQHHRHTGLASPTGLPVWDKAEELHTPVYDLQALINRLWATVHRLLPDSRLKGIEPVSFQLSEFLDGVRLL